MTVLTPLRQGDTVGVIATANICEPERLEAGVQEIVRAGYTPFVHPQSRKSWRRFSGTDDERLAGLHETWANPDVRAIICLRGGYGTQRFLERVDFGIMARSPKPLVGYSDLTALLNAIALQTGQVAFHGPMLRDLRDSGGSPESWAHLWRVLRGEGVYPSDHPAFGEARVMVEGRATGRLFGGNVSILSCDCGTPQQIAPEILLIEDVDADLFRFDRALWHLRRAGVFRELRGVLVGELVGVDDKGPPPFGTDAEGVLRDHFGALGIPVVINLPAGHGQHRTMLPIGAEVTLSAGADGVRLTHAPLFAA